MTFKRRVYARALVHLAPQAQAMASGVTILGQQPFVRFEYDERPPRKVAGR